MNNQINMKQDTRELRHLFVIMARQFGLLQKESSQCCGISQIESHILYEIKRAHNLSLNELARRLDLDNSTISRHIHGLVEKELVQRKSDPKDRRFVTLTLTEQGSKLEKEIDDMMVMWVEDVFSYLPKDTGESMLSQLKQLTEAMSKSEYCCRPPL